MSVYKRGKYWIVQFNHNTRLETGRDDVIRVAYAAVAGEPLRRGMESFLAALSARDGSMPLV